MIIVEKRKTCSFLSLTGGDIFDFQGETLIKLNTEVRVGTIRYNVVYLSDGELGLFNDEIQVSKINALTIV